jgi:hypothetical protein
MFPCFETGMGRRHIFKSMNIKNITEPIPASQALRMKGVGSKTFRQLIRQGLILKADPASACASEEEYQECRRQDSINRQNRIAANRIKKHALAIATAERQLKAAKRKLAELKRIKPDGNKPLPLDREA